MIELVDLTNKKLANWVRAVQESRPEGVTDISSLPDVVFYDITVTCAYESGWFVTGVTREQVEALTVKEAEALALACWKAHNKARHIDPN